jgi:hypothetical protein
MLRTCACGWWSALAPRAASIRRIARRGPLRDRALFPVANFNNPRRRRMPRRPGRGGGMLARRAVPLIETRVGDLHFGPRPPAPSSNDARAGSSVLVVLQNHLPGYRLADDSAGALPRPGNQGHTSLNPAHADGRGGLPAARAVRPPPARLRKAREAPRDTMLHHMSACTFPNQTGHAPEAAVLWRNCRPSDGVSCLPAGKAASASPGVLFSTRTASAASSAVTAGLEPNPGRGIAVVGAMATEMAPGPAAPQPEAARPTGT